MQGLWQLCQQEGIDIEYVALTRRRTVLGWYFRTPDGEPVIALDESLPARPRLERCVLAEEVGHHFTVPTSGLSMTSFSTNLHRLALEKRNRRQDEARAIRWAANYLIPTTELASAVRSGIVGVNELAEYFYVTEWMVWRRLHFLKSDLRDQQQLYIKGWHSLFSPLLVNTMWGQAV